MNDESHYPRITHPKPRSCSFQPLLEPLYCNSPIEPRPSITKRNPFHPPKRFKSPSYAKWYMSLHHPTPQPQSPRSYSPLPIHPPHKLFLPMHPPHKLLLSKGFYTNSPPPPIKTVPHPKTYTNKRPGPSKNHLASPPEADRTINKPSQSAPMQPLEK